MTGGSRSCSAGRFTALSCKGVIKFWQDDAEDGYPTRALWLRCCRLPQQPAWRQLRTHWSQGRDELSHAGSAGADLGWYGVGRDASCSQERPLCPRGRAEPDTSKAACGHCQAPRHGRTSLKRPRIYGSGADTRSPRGDTAGTKSQWGQTGQVTEWRGRQEAGPASPSHPIFHAGPTPAPG